MNTEELIKSNKIIFEAICGSHAYGTNDENSDVDIRGLYVVPKSERITLMDIPQEIGNESQDIKYYELEKFFKLAKDCNPSIIELMWIPDDCVKIMTPLMQKIIDNRSLFISKKAFYTFSGYAHSMLHKAKSQNRYVNNPQPERKPIKTDFCWFIPKFSFSCENHYSENDIKKHNIAPCRPIPLNETQINIQEYHVAALEHVPNTYRMYYYGNVSSGVFRGDDMLVCESIPLEDEISKFSGLLIYNENEFDKATNQWKSYWEWRKHRNEKRWKDQENGVFQYDRKNASHCVRLILSGINIFKTGAPIVRFTGDELQYLRDVKEGKIEYQKLLENIDKLMTGLQENYEKSKLPHGCNLKQINKLFQDIIEIDSRGTDVGWPERRKCGFGNDGANGDTPDFFVRFPDQWAKKRDEEAATMCAKREPTKEEIDRAMVIGKWFFGWTDKDGPCPIGCMDDYWHKKLCSLFEWIAVLETEASKPNV